MTAVDVETPEQRGARLAALRSGARHLIETECVSCWRPTLAAPEAAGRARCSACHAGGVSVALPPVDEPAPGWVWAAAGAPLRGPEAVALRGEHPAPEFVCLDGCDHVRPGPVDTLLARGEVHGWRTEVLHSRGTGVAANGRPLTVADYWSVRAGKRIGEHQYRAFAVRRGLTWDTVGVVGGGRPPFMQLSVTDLVDWLEDPARPDEWFRAVVRRREMQARAAKVVRCPGPGECEWVDGERGEHTHRASGEIKPRQARERVHGG